MESEGLKTTQSFLIQHFKMDNVIVDNLSFNYPGQRDGALKDVNLRIREEDFVLIAGPTGCGKSTLALCLTGLIPRIIKGDMKGRVVVDGKDTTGLEVFQLAQSIGLVFQNAESQLCSLNVEDEVAFGPENLGRSRREIADRIDFALQATDMYDLRNKYTFNLSGGQKQRTVIASSISMLPKILVLDEPLSELDPVRSREILQTLKKLNQEYGITIVLIEHKLEQVLGFVKHAILLKNGEVAAQGRTREVFQDRELVERLKLRIPETLKLSYELMDRGLLSKPVLCMEEARTSLPKIKVPHPLKSTSGSKGSKHRSSSQCLIKAEEMGYQYDDGTEALKDVDLTIFPGEFIAILGGNGVGKTTLALHMTGQLKPTSGKMYIHGRDSKRLNVSDLVGVIGYTFQDPDSQLFCNTVEEELAFGPQKLELPKEEVTKRVDEILHIMNLKEYQDRDPHSLSRGQRLSVAVASILTMKPKMIILDEPTLGQDLNRIQSLMKQLASMNRDGLSVVVITHDVNIASQYIDRAILMDEGQILADGEAHQVLSRQELLDSAGFKPPTAVHLSSLLGLPPMLTVEEIKRVLREG